MAVEFIHYSRELQVQNREGFEVIRTQRPFEITGGVFLLQTVPDALTPRDASDETRGVMMTRYSNGPDTLYMPDNIMSGQKTMEDLAQTVWSQQRWVGRFTEDEQNHMREAYKDPQNPLHAHAKAHGGVFFAQEELRWQFDESIQAGNKGRIPARSILGHGSGQDTKDSAGIVATAWEQVYASDAAREKRLRQNRMKSQQDLYKQAEDK